MYPLEIWHEIFAAACTDGGKTGCALSLVSHHIKSTSDRARYLSIAVHDLQQIVMLAQVLVARPASANVQHLFLTTEKPPPRVRFPKVVASVASAKKARYVGNSYDSYSKSSLADVGSIEQLLTLVASTLLSLSVRLKRSVLPHKLAICFPRLLALSTCKLSYWDAHNFERLRYLHVSNVSKGCVGRELEARLAEVVPPTLTHLRISGVSYDSSLVYFVERQLNVPDVRTAEHPGPKVFPVMRHIYIQPTKYKKVESCTHTGFRGIHSSMMTALENAETSMRAGAGEGTFVCMKEGQGYGYVEAMYDWLDLVNGGEGCWHGESESWLFRNTVV